jgi:hypothetical protein
MKYSILLLLLIAPVFLFNLSCEDPVRTYRCYPTFDLIIDSHVVWSPDNPPEPLARNIVVAPGATLEILAGTEIPFEPGSVLNCGPCGMVMKSNPMLFVEGSLIIRGTESEMVSFVPSDGSETDPMVIRIDEPDSLGGEVFIEWASAGYIGGWGYSPTIRFCDLHKIELYYSGDIEVIGNDVDVISVWGCTGTVAENTVNTTISLRDDSLVVLRNMVTGPGWGERPGILSSGTSKAYIAENCLNQCDIGICINSGSPTIRMNDFIDCPVNLGVFPFLNEAEFDTIDARNNWWGSDNESEILSKIVYKTNGGTESGKVILIEPWETHPVNVCW